MLMIKIITLKNEWDSILNQVDDFDVYHTYAYHDLVKKENEKPILIVFKENDVIIAMPFLKRPIDGTDYFDFTSVYGYPGPISKNISNLIDYKNFEIELKEIFEKENIVCVFSRLNPFIAFQKRILKKIGLTKKLNEVVYIDLKEDLSVQRSHYQNRLKTQINKLRRNCIVKQATKPIEIEQFIAIYNETMFRANAASKYFFKDEYFYNILDKNKLNTDLLIAIDKESDKIMAGALFMKSKNIIQYHLSGTRTEFLPLGPNKLIIDEMRILGSQQKFSILNLGGGVGSTDDSLKRFKVLFSKLREPFFIYKLIVNKKVYHELCENLPKELLNGYFPQYRSVPEYIPQDK